MCLVEIENQVAYLLSEDVPRTEYPSQNNKT